MDEEDFEPAEPSDLGFDPYAGTYVDDFYETDYFEFDTDLGGEW